MLWKIEARVWETFDGWRGAFGVPTFYVGSDSPEAVHDLAVRIVGQPEAHVAYTAVVVDFDFTPIEATYMTFTGRMFASANPLDSTGLVKVPHKKKVVTP